MISITKKFEFDYAHRVLGHSGRCCYLHGHRGVAEVTVSSSKLDGLGMVVDFSELKGRVGSWINEYWDHNILLNDEDPLAFLWDEHKYKCEVFAGKEPYLFPRKNPTAENMAAQLAKIVMNLLPLYNLVHVRLYETPTSWADWDPQGSLKGV